MITSQTALLRAGAATSALLAVFALTSCASASSPTDSESDSSTLAVGSDLTYPPYAYLEGDKPAGFDAEIMEALADQMGVTLDWKDTRFEQLITGVNADQFDVIASALYITAERSESVDYIPYFTTGSSIMTPAGKDPVATAEDLCGLRVAVIKGGVPSQDLVDVSAECRTRGEPAIDIRPFATDPEGTQALRAGQVDAQISDAAVAAEVVKKTEGDLSITSTDLLYPVPVGLAVEKGNSELAEQLRGALEALTDDGTYEELLKKYNLEAPDDADVTEILGS
jgi:ABC-type amino acid transport substrate-binding protein